MAITKNQHYVPQFLLRHFATGGGQAKLNVYDMERDQFRRNQNVRNLLAENYLYDRDNSVEALLSSKVEGPAAEVIAQMVNSPQQTSDIAGRDLLRFVSVLMNRTPAAYSQISDTTNAAIRALAAQIATLNDLDPAGVEGLRAVPSDPSALLAYQVLESALNWPLLSDLCLHLAINNTDSEFILGDHPAFQYNWYLRDSESIAATSVTSRGLQIFLPLSPRVTCCLYDKKVYVYGSKQHNFTWIENPRDIEILNSFQARAAESILVFGSDAMKSAVIELGQKYKEARVFTTHSAVSPPEEAGGGKLTSKQVTWRVQCRLPGMPSFIKVKNKLRRRSAVCEERKPGMMAAQQRALDIVKVRSNRS